jgi:RNA polymerase sigma factor (sigma-70 family)
MCRSPSVPLSLDHLALLITHPKATPATQAVFTSALLTWTRARVATLTKRFGGFNHADEQDLVQAFILRCLTRYLPRWSPTRVALSPYLYRRLHADVVDALRARHRQAARLNDDADLDGVIDDEDARAKYDRLRLERSCEIVDALLETLPRVEQRLIRQTVMGTASLTEIAEEVGVHPSTMSRRRSVGLRRLREGMALAA